MPDYDNELRGALFKNDKKGNDKAPDYKGPAQIKGIEYDMSAWLRTARSGQKYMSVHFEAKGQSSGGGAAPAPTETAPAPTAEDFGMAPGSDPDDIPF